MRIYVDSPEGNITWVNTDLMPVCRLCMSALGAEKNELGVCLAYTTASGALSNVKLATIVFPAYYGKDDGLVKKLSTNVLITGKEDDDRQRAAEMCKAMGFGSETMKAADIERYTDLTRRLVSFYWEIRRGVGRNFDVEFEGWKVRFTADSPSGSGQP